ncbi:unnamed protein product [Ceutorhynchus assimilis]|uniref:Uncharacterized protein n=1 Tax=Ceutorhynchus assimilis TaxID=467358 RepID=A0A9N9MMU7_9CUCU|nr:unnamed protein product [Ceutorhynchus assimilis]
MAIHIHSGKKHLKCNLKESKLQSVPFRIHADCDAPVSTFFEPYVQTGKNDNDKNPNLTASFRGYPLKGRKIELPEGYVGVLLHESSRPSREKDERNFYVVNKFKDMVYWNWDKIPSKNDAYLNVLDWIDVAEVLHSPITEE